MSSRCPALSTAQVHAVGAQETFESMGVGSHIVRTTTIAARRCEQVTHEETPSREKCEGDIQTF